MLEQPWVPSPATEREEVPLDAALPAVPCPWQTPASPEPQPAQLSRGVETPLFWMLQDKDGTCALGLAHRRVVNDPEGAARSPKTCSRPPGQGPEVLGWPWGGGACWLGRQREQGAGNCGRPGREAHDSPRAGGGWAAAPTAPLGPAFLQSAVSCPVMWPRVINTRVLGSLGCVPGRGQPVQ